MQKRTQLVLKLADKGEDNHEPQELNQQRTDNANFSKSNKVIITTSLRVTATEQTSQERVTNAEQIGNANEFNWR